MGVCGSNFTLVNASEIEAVTSTHVHVAASTTTGAKKAPYAAAATILVVSTAVSTGVRDRCPGLASVVFVVVSVVEGLAATHWHTSVFKQWDCAVHVSPAAEARPISTKNSAVR